jgi:hypothetical protein
MINRPIGADSADCLNNDIYIYIHHLGNYCSTIWIYMQWHTQHMFILSTALYRTMLMNCVHGREYSTFTPLFQRPKIGKGKRVQSQKELWKASKPSWKSARDSRWIESKAAKRSMWPARTDFNSDRIWPTMACTSFAMSICIFTEVNIKAASGSLKDRTSGPSQGDMEHYGPCWRQCRSIHPYMFTLHFESMEGMIDFVRSRGIRYAVGV